MDYKFLQSTQKSCNKKEALPRLAPHKESTRCQATAYQKAGTRFPAVNLFIYNSHNILSASRAAFQWELVCICAIISIIEFQNKYFMVLKPSYFFYSHYNYKLFLDFNLTFYGFSSNVPQLDSKKHQVCLRHNPVHVQARHHQSNHILYNLKNSNQMDYHFYV